MLLNLLKCDLQEQDLQEQKFPKNWICKETEVTENEGRQQTVTTVGGNRQEKRKRIMSYFINATIELMEKEGIENLTIRKVAEQAKYNSATLYHYFSNLDELELFASVKCLDEYMRETPLHRVEGKNFQDWYLEQWRCFCRHSFARPRIYNFLFFSPEGTQNLNEVFRRYYEIYPHEKAEKTEDYEEFLKEGDFFKRNEGLLRDVIRERNYEISEQEIRELNEMSVLIYRGMLAIMRSDRDKPTVDEAVNKTVRYLAKALDAYHLG